MEIKKDIENILIEIEKELEEKFEKEFQSLQDFFITEGIKSYLGKLKFMHQEELKENEKIEKIEKLIKKVEEGYIIYN